MVLAIVGGREFNDYELMKESLEPYKGKINLIISGGRRRDEIGADTLAIRYAQEHGIPFKEHYADWDQHGKAAGPLRNTQIVFDCTHLIAFWDGKSTGTKDSINKARRTGKKVTIVEYGN